MCAFCGKEHGYKESHVTTDMFVLWFCSKDCKLRYIRGESDPRTVKHAKGDGE